jgi:hypothetical protein
MRKSRATGMPVCDPQLASLVHDIATQDGVPPSDVIWRGLRTYELLLAAGWTPPVRLAVLEGADA